MSQNKQTTKDIPAKIAALRKQAEKGAYKKFQKAMNVFREGILDLEHASCLFGEVHPPLRDMSSHCQETANAVYDLIFKLEQRLEEKQNENP